MQKFTVQIEETLSLDIEVMAENEAEAINKVKEQYHNQEHVLSGDNYSATTFDIIDNED
jgi:hypothetical protein